MRECGHVDARACACARLLARAQGVDAGRLAPASLHVSVRAPVSMLFVHGDEGHDRGCLLGGAQ
eukprot:15432730-Alexandrium_andersonii.AAC.1